MGTSPSCTEGIHQRGRPEHQAQTVREQSCWLRAALARPAGALPAALGSLSSAVVYNNGRGMENLSEATQPAWGQRRIPHCPPLEQKSGLKCPPEAGTRAPTGLRPCRVGVPSPLFSSHLVLSSTPCSVCLPPWKGQPCPLVRGQQLLASPLAGSW